jgi:hypothetical protein
LICEKQKEQVDKLLWKPKQGTLKQMDEKIVELMNNKILRDNVDPFTEEEVSIPKSKGWK